jgi:hypothetical protein
VLRNGRIPFRGVKAVIPPDTKDVDWGHRRQEFLNTHGLACVAPFPVDISSKLSGVAVRVPASKKDFPLIIQKAKNFNDVISLSD